MGRNHIEDAVPKETGIEVWASGSGAAAGAVQENGAGIWRVCGGAEAVEKGEAASSPRTKEADRGGFESDEGIPRNEAEDGNVPR